MHVESLTLTNFQKHRKLQLSLVPGINVLVGESNRGKSSIIRAFMRLCSNTPSGSSCIRFGKKQTHVEAVISTDNGKRVVRYSKSKNGGTSYSVDQQHYKRCGRGVPEEVGRVLRVIPEINIQPQFRQFFLLDARSGQERAKQLARGTNIDVIGYVITEARRQVNNFEGQAKAKEAEAAEAEAELNGYATLEAAEKQLARSNKLLSSVEELTGIEEALRAAGTSLAEFTTYEKLLEKLPAADDVETYVTALQEKLNVLSKLNEAKSTVQALGSTAGTTTAALTEAGELQVLVEAINTRRSTLGFLEALRGTNEDEEEMLTAIRGFKKTLGSVCVTCGRPL
jgi:exonuclease SbcC